MNSENLKGFGETCGCGRPVRYMNKDGGSCNKYHRCPTYEEQAAIIEEQNIMIFQIKKILREGGHNDIS